jgi:aspartyl-tRNA(Asn)/glutamyl-tRNA(Gln) amidotransferase subunit A
MTDRSLLDMSIADVGAGFRRGEWTPVDVVHETLARMAWTEPVLHAWVTVDPERALSTAATATRELRDGTDRGPLHGIPVGIKDIYDVAGWPTRCGSDACEEVAPAASDAAQVATLLDAGAVVLGKTVTQEFAAGVISAPARNPWDPTRIPGGSSGGSAAAVAVGTCFAALGSDTGGSIRIPAAACGVVGFKPAYGDLDTAGVYPLSWSLDTVGPLARTVADARTVWHVLAGRAMLPGSVPSSAKAAPSGFRVGVPRGFFFEWLQPDVLTAVDAAIDTLRATGVTVVDVSWPLAAAARACGFIINRVETAAVHERVALDDPERFARYGEELRLRIAAGRVISATTYLKAMRARAVIRDSLATLFAAQRLDAIAVPTLATTALAADRLVIEDTGRDESVGAAWTRLTMPFNATGQPVLAMPCGWDRDGLPVGLQLAGRPGDEETLFQIGAALEAALGLCRVRPPLLEDAGVAT